MKKILALAMMLVLATAAVATAGDEAKKAEGKDTSKEVTLTGEVVDLYCYMEHPESATGAEHMKCAQACISKGMPVGFLTADGTVYLIIGQDHEPANKLVGEWAGKQSTITGMVMQNKGMKAIELKTIGEAKS